jgi:hypothetical protein
MSPIEHYFENLLDMGSDIKGEPNKNALSKEVQEAIEICADYIKYNQLLDDTNDDMVAMLESLNFEIDKMFARRIDYTVDKIQDLIQQRIDILRGNKDETISL